MGATLIGAQQFSPAYFVLEGLDLLNHDLAVGARAIVQVQTTGTGGAFGELFQGVVYDLSQAAFPWRGSMVIFPNQELSILSLSGTWFAFAWGHVEAGY